MRFNKIIPLVAVLFFRAVSSFAQEETDTLVIEKREKSYLQLIDTLGESFSMPDSLKAALQMQVEKNKGRKSSVYRIRIFFDNSQNARNVSTEVVDTFKVYYPDIPVYRSYSNPYFKVTVGDFRTKSDAMRFLEAIRPKYPTVFLVKEPFSTI